MVVQKRRVNSGVVFVFLLSWFAAMLSTGSASAASDIPPGPDRFTYISENYTNYQWWLLRWEDSEIVCEINIEHEDLPTLDEVYVDCGEDLYTAWVNQNACPVEILQHSPEECPGYYMHLASSAPAQREISIALPPSVVWLDLEGCIIESTTNRCESPPALALRGDETLSGEEIIRITGELDGEPFSCNGTYCELPLSETDDEGVTLTFWAYSSYGDSSQAFDARLRVSLAEDDESDQFWYVDVLSSQWRGEANASCAESWDAFPPVGGAPEWLSTPEKISDLESDYSYAYLAGNLISRNIVDASQCPDFGLDFNGQATACGLDIAQSAMTEWQIRFDTLIMKSAEETSIPAILLKRLFARESQFWPGIFNAGNDVGLGQLTENGADIAFLWNPVFFEKFCPLVLSDEKCEAGYLFLDEDEQERIRGALVYSVNATCVDCPLGLDITQAEFSVEVFAHTLLGSCEQTGRVVHNNTDEKPGETTSYEDMWKFTLVDYNAGAGCLSLAIGKTLDENDVLDWGNLSNNLTPVCMEAKDYVEDISQ